MFQHVTLLFSFIYAVAFTHILASASALILARDRVRFSGLHVFWMVFTAFELLLNWLALLGYETVKRWSIGEVLLQLSWIIPQYFTSSLVSINVPDKGEVDMGAIYERRRPVLFVAYVVFSVATLVENFFDRNNYEGWNPDDWIRVNFIVSGILIMALIAGWARPRWLQWLAAWGATAFLIWDFVFFSA